jgi:hypothetical protein
MKETLLLRILLLLRLSKNRLAIYPLLPRSALTVVSSGASSDYAYAEFWFDTRVLQPDKTTSFSCLRSVMLGAPCRRIHGRDVEAAGALRL